MLEADKNPKNTISKPQISNLSNKEVEDFFGDKINAYFINLPEIFSQIDPGKFGTTKLNLNVLEILYLSLIHCFERQFNIEKKINSLFAVNEEVEIVKKIIQLKLTVEYINKALIKLDDNDKILSKTSLNLKKWVEKLSNSDDILISLFADYKDFIVHHAQKGDTDPLKLKNSHDILNCSTAYFNALSETLRQIEEKIYPFLQKEELKKLILIKDEACNEAPSALMPIFPVDIVGHEEYLKACIRLAKDISGFDFETNQNPKKLNPIIFALGPPGCGKTAIGHAVGNEFLSHCNKHNIPASYKVIRRTDWASSYQNASANHLKNLFFNLVNESNGVIGIYWPDIDTAFGDRSDPSSSKGEEKQILSTLFGLLDGTILPKNGKWFIICDANNMNMDEAAISRISQNPFILNPFSKAEEFIKLFRIKLMGFNKFIDFTDEQWVIIGNLCLASKLSGRSVENICGNIISKIQDFEYPDEYFSKDHKTKQKIIEDFSKYIPFDEFIKVIEDYIKFSKESEIKEAQDSIMKRKEEIITYRKAYEEALLTEKDTLSLSS